MSDELKKSELEDIDKNSTSPNSIFILPTGWFDRENDTIHKEVELREMTGVEEDMLVAKNLSALRRVEGVLCACVMRVGNATDKAKIKTIIEELTNYDRTFLIYKIRIISVGKAYKFQSSCPNCGEVGLRSVNLEEIIIPGLDDPKKLFYETKLPTGRMARWQVMDGKREAAVIKDLKKINDSYLSMAIFQRLTEINGVPATLESVKALSVKERNHLRKEFQSIEKDVDDQIIVECDKCGKEFSVEADITRPEFFFPVG